MKLPRIEALDLRTQEGRLLAALQRFGEMCDRVHAAYTKMWVASVQWIEWDEISWDDSRYSAKIEGGSYLWEMTDVNFNEHPVMVVTPAEEFGYSSWVWPFGS